MDERRIEVSYRLTKAELREAVRPSVRRFVLRFWAVVVVLVIVVEVLLWLIALGSEESDYALSIFILVMGVLWLPIGWWLGLRTAVNAADPYVFEQRTIRADNSGIEVDRETGHSVVPWRFFSSWFESENLITLVHGEMTCFPVPKRAFPDEDGFRTLVDLARSQVRSPQSSDELPEVSR